VRWTRRRSSAAAAIYRFLEYNDGREARAGKGREAIGAKRNARSGTLQPPEHQAADTGSWAALLKLLTEMSQARLPNARTVMGTWA